MDRLQETWCAVKNIWKRRSFQWSRSTKDSFARTILGTHEFQWYVLFCCSSDELATTESWNFADLYSDILIATTLAIRTACSMISCWRNNVVCLSVCPSVTLCIMAKRCILQQICLNKWIDSALIGAWRYNFQPPTLTLSPQTLCGKTK